MFRRRECFYQSFEQHNQYGQAQSAKFKAFSVKLIMNNSENHLVNNQTAGATDTVCVHKKGKRIVVTNWHDGPPFG